ncbi:hypothetical protein P879_11366 [Paragonimus westermani]|uniref:Ubiquitin carboxyl-terminal hydrolase n=1 Tax=Paragonimus westermani TaxID=34504 RepID=A0A8T0DFR1_9TREM|nr:hypothetical protein P879_11366 [Paragonimus westermani]
MRWVPLESNPDVLNKYLTKLGVPDTWQFRDVLALDDDTLNSVPTPVAAVLLLFPRNAVEDKHQLGKEVDEDKLYMIHQSAENACGTVAVLHALINSRSMVHIPEDSYLARFIAKTRDMNPNQRGVAMAEDTELFEMHESLAHEGQTQVPNRESDTQQHFVAFVEKDDSLYELDGRRTRPVLHGHTTLNSFLKDTAGVIRRFMERDADNVNFGVIALTAA